MYITREDRYQKPSSAIENVAFNNKNLKVLSFWR